MRGRQLEEIQQRFAVQQGRVFEIQQRLDETQALIQEQLLAKPDEIVDPFLSQQRFKYLQYLKMQVEHFRESHTKEMQLLDRVREEMRQAHVRKRSLELLEEKQRTAYLKSIETREANELEDLVVARRHHQR